MQNIRKIGKCKEKNYSWSCCTGITTVKHAMSFSFQFFCAYIWHEIETIFNKFAIMPHMFSACFFCTASTYDYFSHFIKLLEFLLNSCIIFHWMDLAYFNYSIRYLSYFQCFIFINNTEMNTQVHKPFIGSLMVSLDRVLEEKL